MAGMNHKPLIMDKISKFMEKYPDYTMGEIIYCMYAHQKNKITINRKVDLTRITDAELYAGIDRAITNESPEEI